MTDLPDMNDSTLAFTAKVVANILRNGSLEFSHDATADVLDECAKRLVEPDEVKTPACSRCGSTDPRNTICDGFR